MEHIDIKPVRAEWDLMMRDFELDKNRGHFKQNYEYDPSILESDPELKEGFWICSSPPLPLNTRVACSTRRSRKTSATPTCRS